MRLAIDLDGTSATFQRSLCYMLRVYRGCKIPKGLEWWTEWDSYKRFCTNADDKWLWSEGIKLGLFRYAHMEQGCRVALDELAAAGHDFVVATNRPEQAVGDTLDWLSLYWNNLPIKGITISNESKRTIKADLLIDDKIENVEEWKAGRPAILFDQPWNRSMPDSSSLGIYRVKGWANIPTVVAGIVTDLEERRKPHVILAY